jgi:hypothetical protein
MAQSITTRSGSGRKTFEVILRSPRQWPCGGGPAGAGAAAGRAPGGIAADVLFAVPREQATPTTHSRADATKTWRTIDNAFQQLLRDSAYGKKVVSRIFASWNHLNEWLRQIERLRRAA